MKHCRNARRQTGRLQYTHAQTHCQPTHATLLKSPSICKFGARFIVQGHTSRLHWGQEEEQDTLKFYKQHRGVNTQDIFHAPVLF